MVDPRLRGLRDAGATREGVGRVQWSARIVLVVAVMLSGCGSTSSPAPSRSPAANRLARRVGAQGETAYTAGSAEVRNVCALVSAQELNTALGGSYSPAVIRGIANGYMPAALIVQVASRANVHKVDPALTIDALATCSWEDSRSHLPNTEVHPELQYELETYSGAVPESVYLNPAVTIAADFERVPGIGNWAVYSPPEGELVASIGDKVLRIGNDYGGILGGASFKTQYAELAKLISERLR